MRLLNGVPFTGRKTGAGGKARPGQNEESDPGESGAEGTRSQVFQHDCIYILRTSLSDCRATAEDKLYQKEREVAALQAASALIHCHSCSETNVSSKCRHKPLFQPSFSHCHFLLPVPPGTCVLLVPLYYWSLSPETLQGIAKTHPLLRWNSCKPTPSAVQARCPGPVPSALTCPLGPHLYRAPSAVHAPPSPMPDPEQDGYWTGL